MTRWIGLILLVASIPLFFASRGRRLKRVRILYRRILHGGIFLAGILGLCLLIFGRIEEALVVLVTWCIIAWAYNL